MTIVQPDTTRFDRALQPFALPIGLASPMWLAFGAAAGASATWWWMSRWAWMAGLSARKPATAIGPEPGSSAPPLEPVVETALAAPEPEPAIAEAPAIDARPDELTLLRGVGPRVADSLVARGVTTFAQLAAWTDEDLATFDAELKLLGRSKRYDFLGQAREMVAREA